MKRPERNSGRGGGGNGGGGVKSKSPVSSGRFGNRPPWLLYSIAEMDERMQMLKLNTMDEENASNFAGRAEGYFQKRPQLLELLHDLYNSYVSLADRYCQFLSRNEPRRYPSPISPFNFDPYYDPYSDTESSSLSYQTRSPALDADIVVADLVIKGVNYDIILNELNIAEKREFDSSRKIELQKSLIDVLESERVIMLNENASMVFRVDALLEENRGLVSESVYMKKKTAELARYTLRPREEDQRVCVLSRKIQVLEEQVNGLEIQNKEYYDQIVEHEKVERIDSIRPEVRKNRSRNGCLRVNEEDVGTRGRGRVVSEPSQAGKHGLKIWERFKKFKIFTWAA